MCLTLLPGPEQRCPQPRALKLKCQCGSLCSHRAGPHSSGGTGKEKDTREHEWTMVFCWVNHVKGCICWDQETSWFKPLLPSVTTDGCLPSADILVHSPLYATCLYFWHQDGFSGDKILPLWIISLLRFPREMLSVKKESVAESLWIMLAH